MNHGFEMKYPKRHRTHSLEEKSFTFFRSCLPNDWNVNTIDRDYGQDLNIEISENGEYKGLELIVQLKASQESHIVGYSETQSLRVSTYNYLRDNLRVVLIVKFIESENEAYWILLRDIIAPNQESETFTIHIPRENRLSTIHWRLITDHVRDITERKLGSVRRGLK